MHQSRLAEIHVFLRSQTVPLAGEQGGDEAPGLRRIESLRPFPHPMGQPHRQIPPAPGVPLPDGQQLPAAIEPEEHALCKVVAALLAGEGGRTVTLHLGQNPGSRLQRQQVHASVENDPAPQAVYLCLAPGSSGGLRGVVRQLQLQDERCVRQRLRRGQIQRGVTGEPQNPRRAPGGGDPRRPLCPAPQGKGRQPQQQYASRCPEAGLLRQQILAQRASRPEGQGEPHEPAHGYLTGSRRSVRPRI